MPEDHFTDQNRVICSPVGVLGLEHHLSSMYQLFVIPRNLGISVSESSRAEGARREDGSIAQLLGRAVDYVRRLGRFDDQTRLLIRI